MVPLWRLLRFRALAVVVCKLQCLGVGFQLNVRNDLVRRSLDQACEAAIKGGSAALAHLEQSLLIVRAVAEVPKADRKRVRLATELRERLAFQDKARVLNLAVADFQRTWANAQKAEPGSLMHIVHPVETTEASAQMPIDLSVNWLTVVVSKRVGSNVHCHVLPDSAEPVGATPMEGNGGEKGPAAHDLVVPRTSLVPIFPADLAQKAYDALGAMGSLDSIPRTHFMRDGHRPHVDKSTMNRLQKEAKAAYAKQRIFLPMKDMVGSASAGVVALYGPGVSPSTGWSAHTLEALQALRDSLRLAGVAFVKHVGRLNARETRICQTMQTAAAQLRARLNQAMSMHALHDAYQNALKPDADKAAFELLQGRLSAAVAARRVVEDGSGAIVDLSDPARTSDGSGGGAPSSPAALGAWDMSASCQEGLAIEGAAVRKLGGDAAPEYATAFLRTGTRRAVFRMRQVERAPVYIGVADGDVSNHIGFSSSAMDGRCWYILTAGHLRNGSDTVESNTGNLDANVLRTGDTLEVTLNTDVEGPGCGVHELHFALTKSGAGPSERAPRSMRFFATAELASALRFAVCLDRTGDAVELVDVEFNTLEDLDELISTQSPGADMDIVDPLELSSPEQLLACGAALVKKLEGSK